MFLVLKLELGVLLERGEYKPVSCWSSYTVNEAGLIRNASGNDHIVVRVEYDAGNNAGLQWEGKTRAGSGLCAWLMGN
jgi:hypothetical protein